jgi:hypothetical protein
MESKLFFINNEFTYKNTLNEANETFVPRFSLNKYTHDIFKTWEIGREYRYDEAMMVRAMEFGMIITIVYRGADDPFVQGRVRVIYPMCLGYSSKGKPLLRAFHIKGYSFGLNRNTDNNEYIWRMFRTDRIMSMSFGTPTTGGTFFQLSPEGYNANDMGMRGGITKSVNIEEVRSNQKVLVDSKQIVDQSKVTIGKTKKMDTVEAINTNSKIDLTKPFDNKNITKENCNLMRLTFLKNTISGDTICLLGVLGDKGKRVKISSSGKYLGEYVVLKYTMGTALGKPHLKNIDGESLFNLHTFVKIK